MAIYFKTTNPRQLLASFKKAVMEKRVLTWTCDNDSDFTHSTEQWKNLAWLRPEIQAEHLAFFIIKPKNKNITSEVYAVYQGRFAESMLAHCDSEFTATTISSMPEGRDLVQ